MKNIQHYFLFYLESSDGSGLEPEVGLEVLGDLPDEPLEGKLADEEFGRLLVPPDLPEGDGAGPVTVGLLDSAGGRGALASGLGGQLLPRGLASGRLTGGLLSTSHFDEELNLCGEKPQRNIYRKNHSAWGVQNI